MHISVRTIAVALISLGVAACTAMPQRGEGWQPLFDGKTLNGWRPFNHKPAGGWEVVDGTLHAIAKVKGVELITEKKFRDFEFAWEWKVPVAGNNGVKYFVTEARTSAPGHEYQMLDDKAHPDAKHGPIRQTASFYYVLPPAADKAYREPGAWNQSKIVVQGKKVEHWLNGAKVVQYEIGSADWEARRTSSKFANSTKYGRAKRGFIALQDHGDRVEFRNIRLRELP